MISLKICALRLQGPLFTNHAKFKLNLDHRLSFIPSTPSAVAPETDRPRQVCLLAFLNEVLMNVRGCVASGAC